MDNLSKTVDKRAQEDFIKQILNNSSNIYTRSFVNQLLIFFQSQRLQEKAKEKGEDPNAQWGERAEGKKSWENFGRRVKDDADSMVIFAPKVDYARGMNRSGMQNLINLTEQYKNTQPAEFNFDMNGLINYVKSNDKTKYTKKNVGYLERLNSFLKPKKIDTLLRFLKSKKFGDHPIKNGEFLAVEVYDYAQTEPIEGWAGKNGEKPWEPVSKDVWQSSHNQSDENLQIMINALSDYTKNLNIELDMKSYEGRAGGYSSGDKIVINNTSQGIRLFSTLVHELAHELLHWDVENGRKVPKQHNLVEIEAEATAYVVLTHYGLPANEAVNYLILHQGDSNKVMKSFKNVNFAAKGIIENINKRLPVKLAGNKSWYKQIKIAEFKNYLKNTSR